MNTKFTLAIIALVGIGVFALPSTMSLFAGQHSWYNIDETGNQVPCEKCHGDVAAEMGANVDPITGTPGPHAMMSCEFCHRIEAGASSGDDAIWTVVYKNGSVQRLVAMSVFDYEQQNVPSYIGNAETVKQIAARQTAAGKGGWLNAMVSNSSDPTNTTHTNLTLDSRSWAFLELYEAGAPKDTNPTTKNSGVRLGSISTTQFNYNGTQTPTLNFTGLGSRVVNPGSSYHAASLVSCMECHSGPAPLGRETTRTVGKSGLLYNNAEEPACSDCHYGAADPATGNGGARMTNLWAGGFGVTFGKSHSRNDTGAVEAHTPWVTSTEGVSRFNYGANNDACIACHTHVAVDITFDKAYKLKLTAAAGDSSGAGSKYTVGNAAVEGHVVISVYGNQSGQTWAVGDQSITWTPSASEVLYVGGDKTKLVNGLTNDAVDDEAALR